MANRYNRFYNETPTFRRSSNKNQNRFDTYYYKQTIKVCYVYTIPRNYNSKTTCRHSNTRTRIKIWNTRRICY